MDELDRQLHDTALGKGHTVDHNLLLAETAGSVKQDRMKRSIDIKQGYRTMVREGRGGVTPVPPCPGTGYLERHCTAKHPEREGHNNNYKDSVKVHPSACTLPACTHRIIRSYNL